MTARESMIEHSPLAMATTEGPNHELRFVNKAFCSLQGKESWEMVGLPMSEAIAGPGAHSVVALLDRVYGGDNSGFINNPALSDPQFRYNSYLTWVVPVADGSPEGLVIQVTEFVEQTNSTVTLAKAATELNELNAELRDVNEQLVISALQQQTLAERNRAIAEALQYSMLWGHLERTFHDLKVAVFYEPAMDDALVGGDLFDAFSLHNNSIMLVVGDVTGKGLKAAARTVEIRFALRAFAQEHGDPAEVVSRLNEFLCDFHYDDNHLGNDLVVLSVVVLDPVTGAALAASAGAEPPLILRASGAVEEVAARGLILGVDHDAQYETTRFFLHEGDTLLMTTDGITETRNGLDFFGSQRLLEAARKVDDSGILDDVGNAVLNAARAHGGGHFTDDVCLLLARRDRPHGDRSE